MAIYTSISISPLWLNFCIHYWNQFFPFTLQQISGRELPCFCSDFWSTETKAWTRRFKKINQCHLKSVSTCFKKYITGFETSRDTIRNELHSQSPAQLPYGIRGTSVSALASAILAPHNFVAISSPECANCEYSEASIDDIWDFVVYKKEDTPKSTSHWLRCLKHKTHEICPQCFSEMMQPISFKSAPNVLIFESTQEISNLVKLWNLSRKVKLWSCVSKVYYTMRFPLLLEWVVSYGTMMVWPLGVAAKIGGALTSSLPGICWSAKGRNWSQ